MQGEGQESEPEYMLIVVGRMGHGKSSFIRMLTEFIYHEQIKVGGGMKTVTKVSNKYPIKNGFFGGKVILKKLTMQSAKYYQS